jgi:hypothetical protein
MRPGLYVASVLGAAFAAFVGLVGISQQSPVVIGQCIFGLTLFAAIAVFAPNVSGARLPRVWVLLMTTLALAVAAAGGVTGLLGYGPAIATLTVVLIRG